MVDYRPVPDDRREEFQGILDYAFRPHEGPAFDDVDHPAAEMGERRGMFDGDDLLVGCKHLDVEMRVRGDWHPVMGLSAVASPPEHRHGGLVGDMVRESLAEWRADGQYLSALYPFKHAFYRRYGWENVSRQTVLEFDASVLSFAQDAAAGTLRPLDADDYEDVAPVYEAYAEQYGMTVHRTAEWWRNRVFTGWRSDPYAYAWERDGEVRGYVVYTVADGDDGKTFRVRDRAWTDEEAYLNVLRFVHNHEAQVETVRWPDPVDTPLLDLVDDPRAVDVELATGIMFRLVDVPKALERLSYDPAVDASLVVSVADETAGWNEGTYRLDVADGTGTVTRTDADADVRLDVKALSQLVVGYLAPDRAALLDGVSEMAPGAGETLAAVFPPAPVFPRDFF